ncbi:hypothetical protein HNQ03_003235 [Chryseobacterium sp. 16F]|uniref:Uncharacterized protein n=1 Tax=Frigoriflavimonas asaccharolytica TaxID=2735899 RepID=A0A8J8GBE0_9FLAO|nr:hypothetical protein [Frigoriflavimonas asaccharolytica]
MIIYGAVVLFNFNPCGSTIFAKRFDFFRAFFFILNFKLFLDHAQNLETKQKFGLICTRKTSDLLLRVIAFG